MVFSVLSGRRTLSPALLLVVILAVGFGLRVAYLTVDRFHADEALYAGWALLVWDGDPLLTTVPVDKPPFYLYLLAAFVRVLGSSEAVARLPNLMASTLGIAVSYRLGRRLYGLQTGMWAALFVALSPFDILFARTAFTDPMLVLWTLCALWAAAEGHWLRSGLYMGLAFATKQHAVLLIPWVVALGLVQLGLVRRRRGTHAHVEGALKSGFRRLSVGLLGFAIPYALVVAWDSARWEIRPGYWQQSTMSYGGLRWAAAVEWGERLAGWLGWARYLTGSTALSVFLGVGCIALLLRDWQKRPNERSTWLDTLFVISGIGYLIAHAVFAFSIWDRYLLPLVAPAGLLAARIVVQINGWLASARWQIRRRSLADLVHRRGQTALAVAVCLLALLPGWKAAKNGYPVGGEHWAYQGLDQVAAYLKHSAPPDAVLYHHWLRWHYSYYLHDTDFELRYWESGEHLRQEAMRTPERTQYIVLPDWRTQEPDAEDIRFRPVFEAQRQDGSVSLRVYRIELGMS